MQTKIHSTNQASGDKTGKSILAAIPPAQMILTLGANCKCPCIIGKPASFCGCVSHICRTRGIAVAKHMKRIPGGVPECMLMRLYGKRGASYFVLTAFASHLLLYLQICDFICVDRNAFAHAISSTSIMDAASAGKQ